VGAPPLRCTRPRRDRGGARWMSWWSSPSRTAGSRRGGLVIPARDRAYSHGRHRLGGPRRPSCCRRLRLGSAAPGARS
jgi:hypothetical protein